MRSRRTVARWWLYGLPCDMDAILAIARRHRLVAIEDWAHALGATWNGHPVGTIGDAGFFSLQLLEPLNTSGGGMAVTSDEETVARLPQLAAAQRAPSEAQVLRRLRYGRASGSRSDLLSSRRHCSRCCWRARCSKRLPTCDRREKIRSLNPLPTAYRERYGNAQAALGLEALEHLGPWTAATMAHARALDQTVVQRPAVPEGRTHVFYQYAIYAPQREAVVRRCLHRGVTVESLPVDVCPRLPLFGNRHAATPGAARAAVAVQLPVYSSLSSDAVRRVAPVFREAVASA